MLLLSLRLIKNDNELGRASMSLSKLNESSSLFFSMFARLILLSIFSFAHFLQPLSRSLCLSLCLSLSFSPSFPSSYSSVLKGPRTNYQKGHFHLWTAGFNRYLFHAFKINPILQLSVWFVYFVLERSFNGWGGGWVGGLGGECTGCNSPWTSIILDFSTGWSSMQRGHFLSTKTKTIMTIKKTCSTCVAGAAHVGGSGFLQGKHCGCAGWSLYTKSLRWKQAPELLPWESEATAPECCLGLLMLIWHESPQVRHQGQTETEYTRV